MYCDVMVRMLSAGMLILGMGEVDGDFFYLLTTVVCTFLIMEVSRSSEFIQLNPSTQRKAVAV